MIAVDINQTVQTVELRIEDSPVVDLSVTAAPVVEISDVGLPGRDGVPAELTTDLLAHYALTQA